MAEVIVLHNQADYVDQAKNNLPARAIGWAKGERVLVIQEDLGDGEKGQAFEVPSTVGQGMGRRVTQTAHGFTQNTVLRLNGAGTYVRALAVDGQWGTHFVAAVLDSNTFDVATSGAWIAGLGSGSLYLSDTAAGLVTATPTAQLIGHGDNVSIHLAFGGTVATSAFPKGPCNGIDLTGSFPDSLIVEQITGVGAGLVASPAAFQFPTSSWASGGFEGGRGISAGKHFVAGVEIKCWCAQAETGDLYWTDDLWKTTTHDLSLQTAVLGMGGTHRWNVLKFMQFAPAGGFAWVAGEGYDDIHFYAPHVAGSYNADGSLKSSAWVALPFSFSADGRSGAGIDNIA